jgi:putative ABC transport system permease protein
VIAKIALRNTLKNWRPSISALLSLSAAFVSLVLFDGYIADIQKMYMDNFKHRQMLGDLIIENTDQNMQSAEWIADPSQFWLTVEDQNFITQEINKPEISAEVAVKNLQFQGMVTNGQQTQIFMGRGYDIVAGEKMREKNWSWNVTFGKPLDRANDIFAVALGQGLSKKLNCQWTKDPQKLTFYGGYQQVENPFECLTKDLQISATTVTSQLNAIDINAVALLDAGYKDVDDRYIQTSLVAAQTLLNTDKVSFVSFSLNESKNIDQVLKKLNEQFLIQKKHLVAQRWQNHRLGEMYQKTMEFLNIFRNFVLVVIVIVSTLSVLNTMIKLIKERTREIGALRSMGFLNRQIVSMFLLESFYLSLIGSSIGAFLAIVLTLTLNAAGILYKAGLLSESVAFRIAFYPQAYLVAFILLAGLSVCAAYFATRQIIRSKIVDNLNYA